MRGTVAQDELALAALSFKESKVASAPGLVLTRSKKVADKLPTHPEYSLSIAVSMIGAYAHIDGMRILS
jgi:hypothetical protein